MFFRLISLVLLFPADAYSQRMPVSINKGDLLIRFNPTALLDFNDPALAVGIEYRFENSWAAAVEAGYIMHSYQFQQASQTTGFLARPAIRLYPEMGSLYLELEGHYKHVVYRIEDWVGRSAVNGTSTYEQFMKFRYLKQVVGGRIKVGRVYRLTRDGRLYSEIFAGIGIHHTKYKILNEPRSTYNEGRFSRRSGVPLNVMPALPMGVRLMYRIK